MSLDCGHEPSPHGEHTTGTAHTPDGKEICWSCAHDREVEALKTANKYSAYLSEDGKVLTDWPGGILAHITRLHRSRHNIGGWLYHFNAVDVHGAEWYGTTPGHGMYARMHRRKVR